MIIFTRSLHYVKLQKEFLNFCPAVTYSEGIEVPEEIRYQIDVFQ